MTAPQNETTNICIVRVTTGKESSLQWLESFPLKNLEAIGAKFLIKVQGKSVGLNSERAVNPLRHNAILEATTDWIWLIDADVLPTPSAFKRVQDLLSHHKTKNHGLIGGLYSSSEKSTWIERSYNSLCNLWSQTRQIPLAGNMILSKKIIDQDFDLKSVPFGMEEYYLAQLCSSKRVRTAVFDFSLPHQNRKTLSQFFKRSLSHASDKALISKRNVPVKSYLKSLLNLFKQSPLEALMVGLYLCTQLITLILSRILKYFPTAARKTNQEKKHS